MPSGRSRSTGRPHASKGAVLQLVAPKLDCTAETLRTEDIRPCTPQGELGVRHGHTRSTSARHRIRHGIRHTRRPSDGARAGVSQTAVYDTCHVYHDFASGVRDDLNYS